MSLMRCSFLFFQQGYGWAETWFTESTAPDPYADVFAKAAPLANARMALSGNNTYMNGIRISDESKFRDVFLSFFGTGNVGRQGTNGESAPPATCLIWKNNPVNPGAAPSAYRPIRGLPNSMLKTGGIFTPSVGWNTARDTYKLLLNTDGWGWRGASTRQQQLISNVTVAPSGIVSVTLAAPMVGVPLGQKITVSIARVRGASQLNGTRQVVFSAANTFDTVSPVAVLPYSSGGTVLWTQRGFVPAGPTGNWQRVGERKPGRPFYLSRGRRLVRRAA